MHLRDKLLAELPGICSHRIALFGMGGIGKTQIALEYVYTNEKNYARTYWISAVDQTTLLSGYAEIAKMAGVKLAPDSVPLETAKTVLRWLREQSSWLIVIDNLDVIEVIEGFLPETGPHKHVIITTRNPDAQGIPAQGVEVPLLDPEAAVHLLSTLSTIPIPSNSPEQNAAKSIVQRLDCLPLAIEQAGAFIRQVTCGYASFLESYEKNRKELHKWVPKGNRQYRYSVATTWFLSFNLIRETYPDIAKFFQILSFLNPDGIRIDFLVESANGLESALREIIGDDLKRWTALLELEKFSLIKWNRGSNMLVIHRLVQAVIRDEMQAENFIALETAIADLCDTAFPVEWDDTTKPTCRNYFGQVMMPLTLLTIESLKQGAVLDRVARFLFKDGKYGDSLRLHEKSFQIYTNIMGNDHPDTLSSMHNLASIYRDQGKWTEAVKMLEEVLAKSKEVLDEDHPDTLTSMHELALTYSRQGKLTEAVKMLEEVLAKSKEVLDEDHPDTLSSMHELARTYSQQGKLTEAVKMYEEVLAKRKAVLGEEHPNTLASMHELAGIYSQQGKLTEAVKMHEEVLAKRKAVLDEDHPDTLVSMHNLAAACYSQGNVDEATTRFEEVYAKMKLVLGESHPSTLLTKRWVDYIATSDSCGNDVAKIIS